VFKSTFENTAASTTSLSCRITQFPHRTILQGSKPYGCERKLNSPPHQPSKDNRSILSALRSPQRTRVELTFHVVWRLCRGRICSDVKPLAAEPRLRSEGDRESGLMSNAFLGGSSWYWRRRNRPYFESCRAIFFPRQSGTRRAADHMYSPLRHRYSLLAVVER